MPKAIILTVGYSEQPIIYSLKEHKPEYAVFLCTGKSAEKLNKILKECPIEPSKYKKYEVKDVPEQIGNLINYFYQGFRWLRDEKGISPEEIVTDPTGGRKWMSTGAIMIASYLGLNMSYVDAEYVGEGLAVDARTMYLGNLGNAYDQIGFIEVEKAIDYFNRHEFYLAYETFRNIKPSTSQLNDFYQGLARISLSFHKWDLFEHYKTDLSEDFRNGHECIERYLYSSPDETLSNFVEKIKEKEKLSQSLYTSSKPDIRQTVDLLTNAERKISLGKFDDGVARLYRTLESIEQYYLYKEFNGFDTAKPNYQPLDRKIFENFQKICGTPQKIELMEGFILLKLSRHRVGEEIIQKIDGKRAISKFEGIIEARNNSILAHGFKPIKKENAEKFLEMSEELFKNALGKEFEKMCGDFSIPKIPSLFRK